MIISESNGFRRALYALLAMLLSVGVAAGCSSPGSLVRHHGEVADLYHGMGEVHRPVTTSSPLAQEYFDQGLTWAYAFNHDEAIRCFKEAARLDPDCAMAWWGIALCNGPHINNPTLPADRAAAAWEALEEAVARAPNAMPVEQALIDALRHRYAEPAPEDRAALDAGYAEAMSQVWQRYPRDAVVGTLYAEALMDLQPWDMWTRDKQPKGRTLEIVALLEEVLEMSPENPGANHLYIHAVEPSSEPERANVAADRLRQLVPTSGHLVHMPSHIDVLTGRWKEACEQNARAIRVDSQYRQIVPDQGFYHLYMVHNRHMLSFAAMMEGRSRLAIGEADKVVGSIPENVLRENADFMDPFFVVKLDALKRFGRWDEILREPAPPSFLPLSTAMWHFSRGLAHAAKGDLEPARREREALRSAIEALPEDKIFVINKAVDVLEIAREMLDGEIAFREGDIDQAVATLRRAVVLEDKLAYMEPPEWVQPVRHTLGAVLLSAGKPEEAAEVYREDLAIWPGNGWSLHGLNQCYSMMGDKRQAADYLAKFKRAWARADTTIPSSCMCVTEL